MYVVSWTSTADMPPICNCHLGSWVIGQFIVEFEQEGREQANYGDEIIRCLSVDLSVRLAIGFQCAVSGK